MSEKNCDHKGRWRSVSTTFKVSPEEAYQIDMMVEVSGLTKQEYLVRKALNKEIKVHPNVLVRRYLLDYLKELSEELQMCEQLTSDSDVLENLTYLLELIAKICDVEG